MGGGGAGGAGFSTVGGGGAGFSGLTRICPPSTGGTCKLGSLFKLGLFCTPKFRFGSDISGRLSMRSPTLGKLDELVGSCIKEGFSTTPSPAIGVCADTAVDVSD